MPGIRRLFTSTPIATAAAFGSASLWSLAAFAQNAAAPAAGPAQPPAWMNFFPFIVVLGVMYFLMIRPQAKKQKMHQEYLTKLKRGDQVLTGSGILGRIEGITDQFVTLEVADGVRMKMLKAQIVGPASAVTGAATPSEAKA